MDLGDTPESETISLPPATGEQLSNEPQWSHMDMEGLRDFVPNIDSAAPCNKKGPSEEGPV